MNGRDELRELWCSQSSSKTTKVEDVLEFVQKKTNRFDRIIVVRNWIECIAAGLVMVVVGFSAFRSDTALVKAGWLAVAASAAWIIFYLVRFGKGPSSVDPSLDLTGYANALVNQYEHQIKLLKSVKYWYLLPPYLGLLLETVGALRERARGGLSWIDLIWPAMYTAFFAAVWWLNEVYSVGRLQKERAKLLSLITDSDNCTD
jgi:hypothetical protein